MRENKKGQPRRKITPGLPTITYIGAAPTAARRLYQFSPTWLPLHIIGTPPSTSAIQTFATRIATGPACLACRDTFPRPAVGILGEPCRVRQEGNCSQSRKARRVRAHGVQTASVAESDKEPQDDGDPAAGSHPPRPGGPVP